MLYYYNDDNEGLVMDCGTGLGVGLF